METKYQDLETILDRTATNGRLRRAIEAQCEATERHLARAHRMLFVAMAIVVITFSSACTLACTQTPDGRDMNSPLSRSETLDLANKAIEAL